VFGGEKRRGVDKTSKTDKTDICNRHSRHLKPTLTFSSPPSACRTNGRWRDRCCPHGGRGPRLCVGGAGRAPLLDPAQPSRFERPREVRRAEGAARGGGSVQRQQTPTHYDASFSATGCQSAGPTACSSARSDVEYQDMHMPRGAPLSQQTFSSCMGGTAAGGTSSGVRGGRSRPRSQSMKATA
jgi:hypothetical protein